MVRRVKPEDVQWVGVEPNEVTSLGALEDLTHELKEVVETDKSQPLELTGGEKIEYNQEFEIALKGEKRKLVYMGMENPTTAIVKTEDGKFHRLEKRSFLAGDDKSE